MKRIALRWLGALLLSITLAAPALAAGKHLINGIDANYPPFAYVDETGKPAGFDVDSMNWIAKKMGFTVEHKPMDWDGIIPALLAKKIDMVCSGMSISPERKAQANFSDPYWTIRKIFITKKGSKVTEDLQRQDQTRRPARHQRTRNAPEGAGRKEVQLSAALL